MDNPAPIPVFEHFEGRLGELRAMRFWSRVDMRGSDECWLWRGNRSTRGGYGRFKVASYLTVHCNRIAWALSNKAEPGAMLVRHSCDNPPCCNPAHLLLGTHMDNMRDKTERGRHRTGDQSGTRNPSALLTEEQLAEIVARLKRGESNMAISRCMPVGHSLVSRIRLGLSWRRQTEALGYVPTAQFKRSTRSSHPTQGQPA